MLREHRQAKQRVSILVTTHAAAQLLQDRNLGAELEHLLMPCNCAKDSPRVCVENDGGAQAGQVKTWQPSAEEREARLQ